MSRGISVTEFPLKACINLENLCQNFTLLSVLHYEFFDHWKFQLCCTNILKPWKIIFSINSPTRHFAFVTQKIQSSKREMSLTNLPCVLWCKVSRAEEWITSGMIFAFTCFLSYILSNNINWNELLNVFHRLPALRWEMALPIHKGKGASFTSEKCKQLTFISV